MDGMEGGAGKPSEILPSCIIQMKSLRYTSIANANNPSPVPSARAAWYLSQSSNLWGGSVAADVANVSVTPRAISNAAQK